MSWKKVMEIGAGTVFGGPIGGAVVALQNEGKCCCCKNQLRKIHFPVVCDECGGKCCLSECSSPAPDTPYVQKWNGRLCDNCMKKKGTPHKRKYKKAKEGADRVEIWSSNYEGNVPINQSKGTKRLSTDFYEDRDEAELELQVKASYHDFEIIDDLSFQKETRSRGNYKYSVWKAEGLAGHRR